MKKYKMTPVGATPALAGISRRGHFSQPLIIKHNHALNFRLLYAISFCKILSFRRNLQLFFPQKYAILRSEKFYTACRPDHPAGTFTTFRCLLFRKEINHGRFPYFDAMHNAMSTLHAGAQLLLTIRLQDTCGNDAYLEVKQLPGEQSALVCYSTMGRRCLNFQLFRKGWQLCHNADGQLTGRFPSSADSLLSQTDFRAYCREDRLDAARTQRLMEELGQRAGTNYVGAIPQNARTGAQITVESHLGCGARWSYWNQDASPCLPLAAILYWLADFLAGNERRALQSDPQAAALAAQWLARDTAVFFCPSPALTVSSATGHSVPAAQRTRPAPVPAARSKSWQSVLAAMAAV